jgi:hypothetical protein
VNARTVNPETAGLTQSHSLETRGAESVEARKFKDAVLVEIFKAYQASEVVYQKTTNPETRQAILDLKRCYDLAIHHLSPLAIHTRRRWEELNARFSA